MNRNETLIETNIKIDNKAETSKNKSKKWSIAFRQSFIKTLWENSTKRRELCQIYQKQENEYGISFENSVYLYKILPEQTVFGHYKAYKKELSIKEYVELVKSIEKNFANNYEQKNLIEEHIQKTQKISKGQCYLFDIQPYTIKKTRTRTKKIVETQEIEENVAEKLKNVAQKIWYWKQILDKNNTNKFTMAFYYGAYSPDNITPYIEFDKRGKLKRGCSKYWDYLKKEVSRLSNVPVNQIIM